MKTILVTGGNRGIGLEICMQLASMSHRVILCSRDLNKGQAAAQDIPGEIIVRQLDVTDESSIQELFRSVHSEFGKLDVLINNAGVGESSWNRESVSGIRKKLRKEFPWIWRLVKIAKPVLKMTGAGGGKKNAGNVDLMNARHIMETNFWGPWRMIQMFLPLLSRSDDARIINISSGLGELRGLNGEYPGYSMSKSSLNALTIMFSRELAGKGIKVDAMCPGWVRTDMGGPDAPRSVSQGADTAVWLATANDVPSGKFFQDREEIDW